MVTPNTNTSEHLEDSILLAYLRRQQLDDRLRLRVNQHIDIERCSRCRHKLDEMARISVTLDVLGRMPSYQDYPEISVADTFARVQRAANQRTVLQADLSRIKNRQRPRKSAVRLVSLPAAFALTILFTMVIVFANLSVEPMISGLYKVGIISSHYNSTLEVQNHATPMPNLALTATANVNASATPVLTPTATPESGPYIMVCSTPANIANWRLVICGHNFEAGYKVVLVALGKSSALLPNLLVNKRGDFQIGWDIINCGNLPMFIIAYERTNAKPISARLPNISFGSCPLLTPTVGP